MASWRPAGPIIALAALLFWPRPGRAAGAEQVLFAFDDRSLPFQQGVKLDLIGSQVAARNQENVVLRPGPPGSPDAAGCHYYGTVRRVGDELWMWYMGVPRPEGWISGSPVTPDIAQRHSVVCFAKSRDGIHWEKPGLGLVDFNGNRNNNLVGLEGRAFTSDDPCLVLYEPDGPDPARRFKMAFNSARHHLQLGVAYSADGWSWKESAHNPVGPWMEPSGLVKWRGAYYINGQSKGQWSAGGDEVRLLQTLVSYDFEHWSPVSALGFRRDSRLPRPVALTGQTDGEQVHLGAGIWNRGNVLLGFYGMWHGDPSNDRRLVSIDLGLILSHDGLHYYEPIPDFRIVAARELTYHWPYSRVPSIAQGQGFENVGDETLFWYSAWAEPIDGVRVARWPRDRLGYLQMWLGAKNAAVISAPLATGGRPVAVSLNVDGLGPASAFRISILDERMREIPGYSAAACSAPTRSGLRQRVAWGGRDSVSAPGPIRVRIDFAGLRPEDLRLYAAYVTPSP